MYLYRLLNKELHMAIFFIVLRFLSLEMFGPLLVQRLYLLVFPVYWRYLCFQAFRFSDFCGGCTKKFAATNAFATLKSHTRVWFKTQISLILTSCEHKY